MPRDVSDKPLTPGQVADLFNVTTVTVAAWADAGKLPFFRTPGGQRRFRRADVMVLLAEVAPPPETPRAVGL